MPLEINPNREFSGDGYKNVLVKSTNMVAAFPVNMSDDKIASILEADTLGRPHEDINPTYYDTHVLPALEEAKLTGDYTKVYAARRKSIQVDPFINSLNAGATFNLVRDNSPEANAEIAGHPMDAFVGNLIGQTGSILATAGLGEALGVAKLAKNVGLLARGATPLAIRAAEIGSGKVIPKLAGDAIGKVVSSVASSSLLGGLYNAINSSVQQGKLMYNDTEGKLNQEAPDLIKIGKDAVKGMFDWAPYGIGGAFTNKNIVGLSSGSMAVGGTAYLVSKSEGASESDALLNGFVMSAFHGISSGGFVAKTARVELLNKLQDMISGYTRSKNRITEVNNAHQMVGEQAVAAVAKDVLLENDPKAELSNPLDKIAESEDLTKKVVSTIAERVIVGDSGTAKVSNNEASSAISYVKEGKKFYTKLSNDELKVLINEVKNIPTPTNGESQIHLDAITPNLLKYGNELSREDFIKGHSQVGNLLKNKALGDVLTPATVQPKVVAEPKYNYFSTTDLKDMENLVDWESIQQDGGMIVSGGLQNGLDRVVTYSTSGHSQAMQEITPKKSFELLKKARNGEKLTEKQKSDVYRLLEDFRANVKEHLYATDKEIADVTKQLSESEAKAVNDAFEKEAQTYEYDINGDIIEGKPKEVSPFNDAPSGLTAIPGEGIAKPRTLAQGVAEKAIAENLTKGFGDIPEYNTINMAEQAKKAADLLATNPDQAFKIAMGEEAPPVGIIPEAVFVAVENKAILDGDVNTLRDLATASRLSTEATTMGQRIRTLGERDPESPVGAIKEVQAAREKAIYPKGSKGGNIKKALMAEAKKIKESMRKAAPKKQDWQGFIESLEC